MRFAFSCFFSVSLSLSAGLSADTPRNFRVSAVQENQVWIEGGLLDGLQEGVEGEIYYEISVAGQKKRIVPSKVRLHKVEERQSVGTLHERSGIVNVGYNALLVPKPASELLILFNARGKEAFAAKDYNLAKQFYQRILESLPEDPFASQRIKECDDELARLAALARERRNVPYYKEVLRTTMASREPDIALAQTYVDKILTLFPGDPEALKFKEDITKSQPPLQTAESKRAPPEARASAPGPIVNSQPEQKPVQPEARASAPGPIVNRQSSIVNSQPPLPPILKDMVLIPETDAFIGTEAGKTPFANETPKQKIHLSAFYIDKYEVTNEDYKRFCDATGRSHPVYFEKGKYPEGLARRPVVMVGWLDADAYARWAGKRLPTENEWEVAAAGSTGRIWPWGDTWDPSLANTREGGATETGDAGSYPGDVSFYGVCDMAGSVSEWTASWYTPYLGNRRKEREYGERYKVLRGGSVKTSREFARAQFRARLPDSFRSMDLGFRCAISAKDVR